MAKSMDGICAKEESTLFASWAGKSSGQSWRYFGTLGIAVKRANQYTGLQW